MPYKDPKKQKEYVRNWSREYSRRKKAEFLKMKQEIKNLKKKLEARRNG